MASNPGTGVPSGAPIVSQEMGGIVLPIWLQFFLQLWQRTGGAEGSPSIILDSISNALGAMLVRGVTAWQGLNPGPQYSVLQMGATLPEWGDITAASFEAQAANKVLIGPLTGAAETPTFRVLGADDIPSAAYDFSEVPPGSAVALTSTQIKDVTSFSLGAGAWDVWGSLATNAAVTSASGWINTVSATDPTAPNNGAYASWGAQTTCLPVGRIRVEGPVTVYLSIKATFSGSLSVYGFLGAIQA